MWQHDPARYQNSHQKLSVEVVKRWTSLLSSEGADRTILQMIDQRVCERQEACSGYDVTYHMRMCFIIICSSPPQIPSLCPGRSREEPPDALLLRSGDAMVLGGSARCCYHGVPRILEDSMPDWLGRVSPYFLGGLMFSQYLLYSHCHRTS